MPRTCPACQQANPDDSSFCQFCGTALPAVTAGAAGPAEAAPPARSTSRRRAPRPAAGTSGAAPEAAAPAAEPKPGDAAAAPSEPKPEDAAAAAAGPAGGEAAASALTPTGAAGVASAGAAAGGGAVLTSMHRRLGTAGMAAVVAGTLGAAVVVGLVVPKLIGSNPQPVPPPVVPANAVSTPTTAPVSAPTTSIPSSPTTEPSSPTTEPSSPSGPGPSSAGGQTFSNSVVSVSAPAGWSQDSSSTATDLLLNGPDNLETEFVEIDGLPSSTTPSDLVQGDLQSTQKQFPDATICQQPQLTKIPGGLTGLNLSFCFTTSSQGGQAAPIQEVVGLALESAPDGSQAQVEADVYVPQGLSDSQLQSDLGSMVQSVRWLKVNE